MGRTIGFDPVPREFDTPHPATGPDRAEYRTSDHVARLATEAGAVLVEGFTTAPLCTPGAVRPCLEKVFRIGVPVVRGDSGTVWLYVWEGWGEPECCPNWDEVDTKLLLVRRKNVWQVVGLLEFRAT
ncbi:MAG: hypothetical protein AABY91_07960 [Gemmatimonadota bacterium]